MSGSKKRTKTIAVYCSARKTNGDPCKRRPINGGTVCASHGGRAPQVKAAAQRRIMANADRAVAAVVEIMENPSTPSAVKLAAARDLLDRNQLTGKTEVTVELLPWQGLIDRIIVDAPPELPGTSAVLAQYNAEADGEVYDAELVEAEPEQPATPPDDLAPVVELASLSSRPPPRLDPERLAKKVPPRKRKR